MKQFIAMLCLLFIFLGPALAKNSKHSHKSHHKDKKEHHHHDKHDDDDDDDDDRCEKTEFKSWDKLKTSRALSYVEDESSISVSSTCKIKFHKDFSFTTTKDLRISAKKIELKKDTSLIAKRLLLVASKELKFKKKSKLCADIIILETSKLKNDSEVCSRAQVLGSAVGEASAVAILEVSSDSDIVPAQVSFDWSKSFGVFTAATVDLGDGRSLTSSDKSLTASYEAAGSFNTSVTLSTSSGEIKSNVVALEFKEPNPIADFGIWHIIHRGGTPPEVWFSPSIYPIIDQATHIKEYRWRFGEGTELIMPFNESPSGFVSFNYPSMGIYDVEVEVTTEDGFSKTASLTVDLNNPSVPVPKYRVSSFKGAAPFNVTFTGEAYDGEGEAITYNWFFADSGEQFFGTQFQEVTHTFHSEGIHYVYLETRDELRGRRITYIPIYVGDVPEFNGVAPVAITDSSARFGEGPLTVDFSAIRSFDPSGSDIPLSYHWDFGDYRSGELNQAMSANASHTFNHPGSYFVNLTVTNSLGLSHSEFMLVSVDGPEVNDIDFEVTPTGNPFEFAFSAHGYFLETDYSMESARWAFGDNTYQTYEPYVVHQFQGAGTYDVELKIRRLDGAFDSYTRRLVVSGSEQAPTIDIIKQSEWFNLGDTIQLAANFSAGAASDKTIYRWSLGDQTIIKGQGDNFKTIAHSYLEAEDKNIRLTVTGENGLTATVDSFIRHNKFAPKIDDIKVYGLEAPAPVKLGLAPGEHTRDHDGNLSHFIYDFGDNSPNVTTADGYLEHHYSQAGTYLIAVTAVDITGLSTRFEKQIVVKENQAPVITHVPVYGNTDVPAPVTLGFAPHEGTVDDQGIQRWIYSFGDGTEEVETTSGYLEHEFQSSGVFSVQITAIDPFGLSATYSFGLEIKQNQAPILSNFNLIVPDEPAPVLVSVDASAFASDTDGYLTNYEYSWGDGLVEQSDSAFVSHTYLYSGLYTVSVRVSDDKGSWSEPVFKEINVSENLAPISEITRVSGFDYVPALLSFTGSKSKDADGQISAYHWAVSDGRFFDGPEVSINFNSAGTYELSLQVVDDKGGIGTTSLTLNIVENNNPVANFDILKNSVFTYEVFELDASPSFDPDVDQILDYEWIDSAGQRYYGQKVYPFLSEPGVYSFTLTVKDRVGGSASISKNILVESSTLPAPLAAIEVKGGIGTNGGYVGEVLFYADDSSGNGSEIASYEWSFSDGSFYEGDFVRKSFTEVGEYTVELTVRTVDGRANREVKSFIVEDLINPKLVKTKHILIHSGFDTTTFNPLGVNASFSLSAGHFDLNETIEIFVNSTPVKKESVISTEGTISSAISLEDGVNKISLLAYDENNNKIESHYIVWAGSKALTLGLQGENGLVPMEIVGTIKLEKDLHVSLQATSNPEGQIIFSNIPNEDLIFTAISSQIAFIEFIKSTDVNVTVISKEIYPEHLNSENLDFSSGLAHWSFDGPNSAVVRNLDSLTINLNPGEEVNLQRSFIANEEAFGSFDTGAIFVDTSGVESGLLVNLSTNETSEVVEVFQNGKPIQRFGGKLSVFTSPDDVIVYIKAIKVNSSIESTMIDSFLKPAYASGGSQFTQKGYASSVFTVVHSKLLEETKPSLAEDKGFFPINLLSIVDFDYVHSKLEYLHKNNLFVDVLIKSTKEISNMEITSLIVSQNTKIVGKFPSAKIENLHCLPFHCVKITDGESDHLPLIFEKNLNRTDPVIIAIQMSLAQDTGEIKNINLVKEFKVTDFLFKHENTETDSHYDAGDAQHFNLSTSINNEFNDLGDFWSNSKTIDLLKSFIARNPNFKVGDVSNINGGGFAEHVGHKDGLSFDAKSKYYGGTLTFQEKTMHELDELLSDTAIQPLFDIALAYINNPSMVKRTENFCSHGRTIDNYISNRVDESDHKDHWHFNVAADPKTSKIPGLSKRPHFKLLGTSTEKSLRHPSYPDYSYIQFENFYKYNSGKKIELGRVAFKLVDKITDKTLYESILNEKKTEYVDDFIILKVVKDGNGKDAIVYKVKTESLKLIQNVDDLPKYELVATAISDTTNYVDYCNVERVKLLDVIDDCNNDGSTDDPAFLTTEGGGIGFNVNFSPLHVVGGDARICGASTIDDDAKVLVYDGAIIEDSYIGPACNGVIIQGDVKINGNSSICEDYLVQGEAAGFVDIMGDTIRVNNSRLSGDILIESNTTIDNQTKITGSSVYVARSILNKVTIWGGATITDSYVGDTDINGMLGDQDSNFSSRLQLQDTSVFNADLSGNGLINGFINTGGRFEGYGSFQMPTYTAVLHLFPSGGIFRNGLAKGNGYIAGFIQDGGIGEFYSTTYFRSGVFSNASIGANGYARCHFLVQGGLLNRNICHQVYNGSRYPTVMNLDDWLAGKSWPTP